MGSMKKRQPDRRPISARENLFSQQTSHLLAKWQVTPNYISIASILFSAVVAGCLIMTSQKNSPIYWWLAAVFIVLRLFANMLDGMVAVETDVTSPIGELFNEVPDRISDIIIFIGAGYAYGGVESLGYLAAVMSLLVAYIRALGNYMGVDKLFLGPMAKSHRMFTLAILCVCYGTFSSFYSIPALMTWGMVVIVLGCALTFIRRLQRIVAEVRHDQ